MTASLQFDIFLEAPPSFGSVVPRLVDPNGLIPMQYIGLNLSTAKQVLINGVPCTGLVVISAMEIQFLSPALPVGGPYAITVVTNGGSVTTPGQVRSYYPNVIVGLHLYESEAGVVGSPVTGWNDQVGAANLTAAGAQEPAYVVARFGENRRHALVFDGVANQMNLGAPISFGARSTFVAMKWGFSTFNGVPPTGEFVIGPGVAPDAGVHDFAIDAFGLGAAARLRTVDADAATDFHTAPPDIQLLNGGPRIVGIVADGAGAGPLKFFYDNTQQGATQFDPYGIGRAAWDRIGNGTGNPFFGEFGALAQSETVLSAPDQADLVAWMFGKYISRSYAFPIVSLNTPWCARDGAGLVAIDNDIYQLGGWNGSAPPPFDGGLSRVTNEVWKSSDFGATWVLIRPEQPTPPPGVMWTPRHTAGVTAHVFNGQTWIYVIGSDVYNGPGSNPIAGGGIGTSDVWRSLDGITWEEVTSTAPWGPIVLHMVASFQGALWVMGGQTNGVDPASATNAVWKSVDGGLTWIAQPNAPWSARALVNSGQALPVFKNKLWLMGGGTYATTSLNDVWSFDGLTWVQVSAAAAWSTRYYNATLAWNGKLWAINGFNVPGVTNIGDCWSSPDGITWTQQTIVPWRTSHADGIVALADRMVKAAGNGNVQQPGDPGIGQVQNIIQLGFVP